MDLYRQMGDQLRALFDDLFDPRLEGQTRQKMAKILNIAGQIGGSIQVEAERLNEDVMQFLETPEDPRKLGIMKKHALRLEQETREL